MRRLLVLLCLLVSVSSAAAQGLINGHRTIAGGLNACTSGGAANAYTCDLTPDLPAYVARACFLMLANHTNSGAATFNVDGRGPKAIKKWVGGTLIALTGNEITSGQFVELCYDGTDMQLASGTGGSGGGGSSTVF